MIVGDGNAVMAQDAKPFTQLFRREGEGHSGPRILALHRGTFNNRPAHPHPRFAPDGRHVLYTSDLTGYSNMYLVEMRDFAHLPELTQPSCDGSRQELSRRRRDC